MTTTQRRYTHIVACPNCDADLVRTGYFGYPEYGENQLHYYDCFGCHTKVSVFVPTKPPRLDQM